VGDSALVKTLKQNYLGLQRGDYFSSRDGYCMLMPASRDAVIMGGPEHGKELDIFSQPISAGVSVRVNCYMDINPRKYTVLASYPSELFRHSAIVTGPSVYSAAEGPVVPYFIITAAEPIQLTEQDLIFNFYLVA
jgi:hypothetical protein